MPVVPESRVVSQTLKKARLSVPAPSSLVLCEDSRHPQPVAVRMSKDRSDQNLPMKDSSILYPKPRKPRKRRKRTSEVGLQHGAALKLGDVFLGELGHRG